MGGLHTSGQRGGRGPALLSGRLLVKATVVGACLVSGIAVTRATIVPAPEQVTSAASDVAAGHDHGGSVPLVAPAGEPQGGAPPAVAADPTVIRAGLQECARALQMGGAALESAAVSHKHWTRHVSTVFDLEAGRITWDRSAAVWNTTTANTNSDVKQFRTALSRYREASATCADLQPARLPVEWQETAFRCSRRSAGVDAAVEASALMVQDWADHVRTLRSLSGTTRQQYMLMCSRMVAAGKPNLTGYTTARDTMSQLPDCGDSV